MQRTNDFYFIRPDVPYNRLAGIDSQDLIPLVNEYILRTSDLLNSFLHKFQQKIDRIEQRMTSIEVMIQLLEKKLEKVSVKGNRPQIKPNTGSSNAEEQQLTPDFPTTSDDIKDDDTDVVNEEQPSTEGMIKIKDHPLYSKYFKMLRVGIPELAVVQKMASEGINGDFLSTPDKLIPLE
ncbi:unnamed protein product [Bursaphelenchus xylophilus]|uniref:(pine wood nematode) hypothetical protein n=1 Tax=Bursaphelenchus xylophilus TaxID=6326 RepID=A0A1I7RPP1_BURXY|nr:unnamed protein product [Bursaphelenchus xylophilus]CAG9096375.1 unnamed protein product [Bursaphelenchus xylophilus]